MMKPRRVADILGIFPPAEKEQNCPEFCLPKCRVGMEFEWENTQAFTILSSSVKEVAEFYKYYSPHNDGSLRNNGMEFVFNGPKTGTGILTALDLMEEISRKYNFQASYRTSLHLHLDMQDTSIPDDIDTFNILYCIFERFFYKFVGKNRDTSNYCVPWYMHPQHFQVYKKAIRGYGSSNDLAAVFKNNKSFKYSGLNMFSLGDFGTVEGRQAPVDMQKAKIIIWTNVFMRLKKWVLEHRHVQGEAVFTHLEKTGPLQFMLEVFGDQYKDLIKFSKNPLSDIKEGLNTAYHYWAIG